MFTHFQDSSLEEAQKLNQAGDGLLLGIASWLAASPHEGVRWLSGAMILGMALPPWLLTSRMLRHYDTENGRGALGDAALTAVLAGAIAVPMGLLGAVAPDLLMGASVWRFLLILLLSMGLLRAALVGRRLIRIEPSEEILIVGVGPLGKLTGQGLRVGETGRRLLGYLRFDDEVPHRKLGGEVLGTADELEVVLKEHVVDEVYFASWGVQHNAAIQAAIQTCERFGVPFALPACTYRLGRAKPAPGMGVQDGYVHFQSVHGDRLHQWLKRLFDMMASGAALVALSPLLLATALAVKLTSKGPVLFKQERVGLRGRTFKMLKFRSMVQNAEELKEKLMAHNEQTGPVFKMTHDPRVTWIGRWMRKFSVDELPQLINVLRGDMSIVGPRPPLPSEVAKYEGWQRRRLSVRPGLTCVWQVSGRNQISFTEWMMLDMRYIDQWSLGFDFNLILKTVPVVLTGRGASLCRAITEKLC